MIAAGIGGLLLYDDVEFRSDTRQRAILAHYLPEADCRGARFTLLEREDAISDWRYVVRISGSAVCTNSILTATRRRGYVEDRSSNKVSGLGPPDQSTEDEAVAFDFDHEPGAVIWTRDKT